MVSGRGGEVKIWGAQRSVRAGRSAKRATAKIRPASWRGHRSDGLVRLRPYIPFTPRRLWIPLLPFAILRPTIPRPTLVTVPIFLVSVYVVVLLNSDSFAAAQAGDTGTVWDNGGAASPLYWAWYIALAVMGLVLASTAGWDRLATISADRLEPGMLVRLPGRAFTAGWIESADQLGDLLDLEFVGGHRYTVVADRSFTVLRLRSI